MTSEVRAPHMGIKWLGLGFLIALVVGTGQGQAQTVYRVEPGQDYRPILNRLQPGDELVLLPGIHEQSASFRLEGDADAPITIRGQRDAAGNLPEVRWTRRGRNLWEIRGQYLHIRDLVLHNPNHYAIRVGGSSHITLENVTIRDSGAGLSANQASVHALHIRNCRFLGNRETDLYIGVHEGNHRPGAAQITDFLLEGTVIDGSGHQPGSTAQRGIQMKHDVEGTVRANFMIHTRDPCVHGFGIVDVDTGRRQVIENNILVRGGNRVILLDGGHVTVHGNLVLGGTAGGIEARVRNLPYEADVCDGLVITDNLIAANRGRGDLRLPSPIRNPVIRGNRIFTRAGDPGLVNLPDGPNVQENGTEEARPALLETIEALRHVVPSNQAVRETVQAMKSDRPQTQEQLIALLQRLL